MLLCAYCAEPSESLDHVVPRSYLPPDHPATQYRREYCVPACIECNTLLSNRAFHTVGSRANFLAKRYKRRYAREMAVPHWTAAELRQLDRSLRAYVKGHLRMGELARKRIAACEQVAAICPTVDEVWSAQEED